MVPSYFEQITTLESDYDEILHLTANENVMSDLALHFYRSKLAHRYNMGEGVDGVFVHSNFAAKGMPEISELINDASVKLKVMLNAGLVNLNCLSGVHAMISVLLSTTDPGDQIMTVSSKHGGHFCTKGIVERSGRGHVFAEYDHANLTFSVDGIAEIFKKNNCKALYLDTSVLLKPHPIKLLREALGNEAIIIYDASHTIGLIMGGKFQSPLLEGANIIVANTHKTLPGPHHGLIAFRDEADAQDFNKIIHNNFYSSTHINSVIALAITIIEMDIWGKEYADQIIRNSNHLGSCLEQYGYNVRKLDQNKFTENHQLHVYVKEENKIIVKRFLDNNMSVNTSKALGNDLFLRLGLQEVTRRGMKEKDIEQIAVFIKKILRDEYVKKDVIDFNSKFINVNYGFGMEHIHKPMVFNS
ncbi:hypothetical protein NSS64_01675 [Paenibacillus sp. FSL H8-0122]|uniref:hypothetical protein n=1 Tax=Paenibacillus sp. FSL H8-0122 TaxID=2954510 RepID=UPI0030F674EA